MLRTRIRPPGFVEPCQPTSAPAPPSGAGWVHEIKLDGYRLLGLKKGTGARLFTRNGNDWTERFPAVTAALKGLRVASCLIDGEVAVTDERGLAVFDGLRRGAKIKPTAALHAFDLLELDGEDLRDRPLELRKRSLAHLLAGAGPGLQLLEHLHEDGAIVYAHACALGCEGIVSKRLGSRYVSGRSDAWRKVKNPAAPAVRREAQEDWNERRRR